MGFAQNPVHPCNQRRRLEILDGCQGAILPDADRRAMLGEFLSLIPV